ncbi:hypothetical protein GCM10012275_43030 [Longimycelium tulufanense]|uniref:Uncharacterized protein n=1 Tax=Longimycelium tulufanense TaxID=907463 RepID=A0A8J3FY18_9PSEU|nr:hypothetical protein [Longimycelium tulufanense]GGM67822.1 hypothetical protein GCM10012275_43030 [Longimycelium tulufanense]
MTWTTVRLDELRRRSSRLSVRLASTPAPPPAASTLDVEALAAGRIAAAEYEGTQRGYAAGYEHAHRHDPHLAPEWDLEC